MIPEPEERLVPEPEERHRDLIAAILTVAMYAADPDRADGECRQSFGTDLDADERLSRFDCVYYTWGNFRERVAERLDDRASERDG